MRIGVIGRTGMLLRAAHRVVERGHRISFVQTCRPESHYDADRAEFERLSAEQGAPFIDTPRIAEALPIWRRTHTDVAISVNWPTLIGDEALGAFPFGILNAHAGDLPRYRGNAGPNWAILNHEPEVGLTIHRMTAELDAGPFLHKAFLKIDEATYVGDIYAWLDAAVPEAFATALDRIADPGFIAQDPAIRPHRTFPRRPSDGRIDWRASSRAVLALIRASSHPFDGAFTTLEGEEPVRIFRARRHQPAFDFHAVPGQVCMKLGGNPVVATGDGMIEIEECRTRDGDSSATKALICASLRNRLV